MSGNKMRSGWVDASRVFAMLLIVLYHIPSSAFPAPEPSSIACMVGAFFNHSGAALALFFLLAGYFTKQKWILSKWLQRLLALTIPYIIWNILFAAGLRDECSFSRIFGIGSVSGVCADYPLWFVRSLIFITLLQPLWRFYPTIWLSVCICFAYWGNSWHWDVLTYLPFPRPEDCCLFLLGVILSRFELNRLHKYIVFYIPVFILVYLLYPLCFECHFAVLSNLGMAIFILSAFAFMEKFFQKAVCWVASLNKSCFLVYSTHAGIIVVAGVVYHTYAESTDFSISSLYIPLVLAIYAANIAVYNILNKYIPWILPLIAHTGSLFHKKTKV